MSPALIHPPCPATPAERVDYIFGLMTRLVWKRGRTGPELARAWGIGLSSIENYATDASRRVKSQMNDPEVVAADTGLLVRHALDELVLEGKWRDVISGAEVLSKLTGAVAPTKLTVETKPAELSPEELRKQTAEAIRVLAREDPELVKALMAQGAEGDEKKGDE